MKRLLLSAVWLATSAIACIADRATEADETNVVESCPGAFVDEHGFCRAEDGTFASLSCCASSEACGQATVDVHGICRRKDNGQFAPIACCADLCAGTSFDEEGRCRKESGQFAPGGCCADECGFGECDLAVDADRFVGDLRDALVDHYAEHGGDIEASGGSSLAEAQAAVEASAVSILSDPADDPEGHDLGTFTVLSHPDVVFPGSDIVWFGAYDTTTGTLDAIYSFN